MMENIAPPSFAENWDNVGLIVGRREKPITKILVALDATSAVVAEAIALGAELIITHHPIIFKAISKINGDSPLGEKLLILAERQISVFSAHTNLDIAQGGTNDILAERLGLSDISPLLPVGNAAANGLSIGRKGVLPLPLRLADFADRVKRSVGLSAIRFVGDADQRIKTVGLSTGSASNAANFKEAALGGCDVFVTGDIRFHEAQDALAIGLALVDATHYASENLAVEKLSGYLRRELHKIGMETEVTVACSSVDGQVFKDR
jgi:dinuclear metal center YbgI/SA1388 family protein